MFNQFGHFGAPDQLSSNYGQDRSFTDIASDYYDQFKSQYTPEPGYSEQTPEDFASQPAYVRAGQTLPFIKGGATDAQVEKATGIKGLVSEIQKRMGVAVTGKIDDAQIRSYQKAKFGSDDGVIGKNTYTALGFTAPFPKSQRASTTQITPKEKEELAVGSDPFYKKNWFLYGVSGLALTGAIYYLFIKE